LYKTFRKSDAPFILGSMIVQRDNRSSFSCDVGIVRVHFAISHGSYGVDDPHRHFCCKSCAELAKTHENTKEFLPT